MNKYSYIKVIQGYYNGWEDMTYAETSKEAKQNLKDYQDNCKGVAFRVISRRVKDYVDSCNELPEYC